MEFVERTGTGNVPKNTGVAGLLKYISALLTELPRVKEIVIKSTGLVEYTWYSPANVTEDKVIDVPFENLLPYAIIRNALIQEVTPTDIAPAAAIVSLFTACHKDRLYPICVVIGTETKLWSWLGLERSDTLFGYTVLMDQEVPDDAVILCASFARTTQIIDTYCSYKLAMETPL